MPEKTSPSDAQAGSLPRESVVSQRYVVQELLGRGGMGHVYRVFDTARGHDVALKQLRLSSDTKASLPPRTEPLSSRRLTLDAATREQRLALFQREYHTLAELAHPRIIEAYEYGFDRGVPFYTMELLTGRDIAELAPSPWPRVCVVLRDVASALTLLHSRRLLHRDLSPTNVHQQRDGSCKLIDFGAMGSMGKPTAIVGTPPFMPPELLKQLSLDARADLYSLAALGYFLLTGRTVHPARSLAELYNFVEARPSAPSLHAMGIPRALDALILQMLSPDPAARPSSTIEVLERLSAIDGVELDSSKRNLPLGVSTPSLVGRDTELKLVQRRVQLALRGGGGSLLVLGPPGSGRSRFLDACVLEGRLSGARVLRGAADTSGSEPYGTVSALLRQLNDSLGSSERAELPLPHDVARALFPDDERTTGTHRMSPSPARASRPEERDDAALHASLLHYFATVAQRRCVMLAIDDLERVDALSATLIGALAQRAPRESLLVIATSDGEALADAGEAARAFKASARELSLRPLGQPEIESLLQSLFGEVPNLAPLAARLHALGAGSPGTTMDLAQHLVDAGVIRCEMGGYFLPEQLGHGDLPTSLTDALRARVQRLSADARALALTLAVSGDAPLTVAESFAISQLEGEPRGRAALAELSDAQIAEQRGPHLALRQGAMADALISTLPRVTRLCLHERIAAALVADEARQLHAAEHYFRAERVPEAVDVLLAATASSYAGRTWHPGYAALVERGIRACARFGRPARDAFALESALVQHVLCFNEPYEREHLLAFSRTLYRLSGLSDYQELGPSLPPDQRLGEALRRAEQRYQSTPEEERVLSPDAALRELVSYLSKLSGFASSTFDLDLLNSLPSLAPFVPLSPTIYAVETLSDALRETREGRFERYQTMIEGLAERLRAPDGCGFPAPEARSFRVNLIYGLGLLVGALGRREAFTWAEEMESVPSQRINAWRIRQIAELFACDPEAAEACRRKVELLQMQAPSRQFHQGATVEAESIAYVLSDDLLGLRRVLPAIEEMAAKHAGWRPVLWNVRAALQRVRGRTHEALALSEAALQMLPAAEHSQWNHAAGGKLHALVELGRAQEAQKLGEGWVRLCEQRGWKVARQMIELPLADAEAVLGQYARAEARITRMIGENEAAGIGGLHLGILYEARARHAVLARDRERFAAAYTACTRLLRHGRHPAVTARLDRLLDQARAAGVATAPSARDGRQELSAEAVSSRLLACTPAERGPQALQLLMSATGASAGHLYRVGARGVEALASFSGVPAPAYLHEFLQRYLQSAEVVNDQTVDLSYQTSIIEPSLTIEPVLLATKVARSERKIVAVAALSFAGGRRWPDPSLLEAIAARLLT